MYIPRKLLVDGRAYREDELLHVGSVFIVLAEPGAGKTELLGKLGSLLGSAPVRASVFRSRQLAASKAPLVIDAMDEVARIDRLALDEIVVKASDMQSDVVVFAGRSSEWDPSVTEHVKDCFGVDPVVVWLEPFTTEEQRQLFDAKFPGEVFEHFVREAGRFELVPLFGNPQFLQLFGEAYVESGRSFTSRKAIYADAVRRLAHEANKKVSQAGRPPLDRIVELAGEVFAKLMLSGASGVSATEELGAVEFPYLASIVSDAPHEARYLVDTRLLKPSAEAGQHEPVHRIVAEFCAARFLVGRIDDPGNLLSLRRVLAVVAPNSVVRTELRGMLGWMAALSSEPTQTTLVELDPYAAFANGDPSQLTVKAKKALLTKLEKVALDDPHFRGSDVWRQFNVGKFFTPDIQADVVAILNSAGTGTSLRNLVIELIKSSGCAQQFTSQLSALVIDPNGHSSTRKGAQAAMFEVAENDPVPDLGPLRAEASAISLELAASIVRHVGAVKVTVPVVVDLLRELTKLYPQSPGARDTLSGSRHFIRALVGMLDLPVLIAALDGLTHNLTCTCNPKFDALCECRSGASKVAGFLLDRYFTICTTVDAETLWGWLKNLRSRDFDSNDGKAVVALGNNHELRRQTQWLTLTENSDPDKTNDALGSLFQTSTYPGLRVHTGDMEALAERAFGQGNVTVWGVLWRAHDRYSNSRANRMRTLQRAHTRQNVAFMAEWARKTVWWRAIDRRDHFRIRSRRRSYEALEAQREEESRNKLLTERAKIEAGEHWGWLHEFAELYLLEPEKLAENPDYGDTPKRAILNCIAFLTPAVPTLAVIGAGKQRAIAEVLLAHCILRFREGMPLDDLSEPILRAAATEMGSYPTIKDELELNTLNAEFGRLVFATPGAPEEFAKDFIEPALALTVDSVTKVHWLDEKPAFHHLRATMPLEWLEKYPQMPLQQARVLFEMAAEHGDRAQLDALIDRRFNDPVKDSGEDTAADKLARARHRFWALNAFFYSTPAFEPAWQELRQDKNNLLAIQDRVGILSYDAEGKVPALSAEAIYRIMDGFVGQWPKVHLPSVSGTGSPKNEVAYRFLDRLPWRLGRETPSRKLPVIERMLLDARFADFRPTLLTLRAEARRQLALQDFRAPSPTDVCALLDHNEIASVEDLRALLVEQLAEMQVWLKGIETDPLVTFYSAGKHVDENTGRNRVVDFLRGRMTALGLSVVIEHHMASSNRCDFTVSATVSGARCLLVVEVKGQWHDKLFTAASAQLMDRYSIHPDAAGQGIFLVFWFGDEGDSIAGKPDLTITSAEQLKGAILAQMSEELKAVIDVVVLDVSRAPIVAKPPKKGRPGKKGAAAGTAL